MALVLSGEEMVWQSPVDMCALVTGADVAEKKNGDGFGCRGIGAGGTRT